MGIKVTKARRNLYRVFLPCGEIIVTFSQLMKALEVLKK